MASQHPEPPFQERNPITHQKHKREVFRQITLPAVMGGGILLLVAVVVLVRAASGTGDVSQAADAALIVMIIPTMLIVLLIMLTFAGLIYLITRLLGTAPFFFRRVQDFFSLVALRVRHASDSAVEPFIRGRASWASLRALRRKKRW